ASVKFFGNTSFVLAAGSILGSLLNIRLIRKHIRGDIIVMLSTLMMLAAGLGVYLLQETVWFFIPMALVSLSFGLALPNLFSTALINYRNHLGTAGALLGLFYYLIIGFGLDHAAHVGNLAMTLLVCGGCSFVLVLLKLFTAKTSKQTSENATTS
ncbi:major facilitator transporter, partial [Photobacterium angustum]